MKSSYNKTTTRSAADCRTRRFKRADGNAHVGAAGPSHIKGICGAFDFAEAENQPERPYISSGAT